MPIYVYNCTSCGQNVDTFHLLGEKLTICPLCDKEETLVRDYTASFTLNKKNSEYKQPAGGLVRDYIEQTKQEVQQEKLKLLKEDFDD